MKIRTDFVTNSSSSSFISLGVFDETLVEIFAEALKQKGILKTPRHFLGGVSVTSDCVTITTSLCDLDPRGGYAINGMDPQENYSSYLIHKDSKNARTLYNFMNAFEVFINEENGIDGERVNDAIIRAFKDNKVITEVYFAETDGFELKDFYLEDIIPSNMILDHNNILVEYTESDSDDGVLILPSKVRGIKQGLLSKLSKTKKIIMNSGCEIHSNIFKGAESLEEIDMGNSYISVVPKGIFKDCKFVKKITMCNFQELEGDIFKSLNRLEEVDFSHVYSGIMLDTILQHAMFIKRIKARISHMVASNVLNQILDLEELELIDDYTTDTLPLNFCCNLTHLKKVVLPEKSWSGIVKISNGCFENCTSLSEINLPNTLTYIGSSAFLSCNKLPAIIQNRISAIKSDSPAFDKLVKEAVDYIQTHGLSSYKFDRFNRLFQLKQEYQMWHELYDEHFDTLDTLNKGNYRYVVWLNSKNLENDPNSIYSESLKELSWKQTKEISNATDFLIVDTANIPSFDRFLQKQSRIASGDIQGAAVFGNNPLEKAIKLKSEGSSIKILSLSDFCELLKKGDFEEVVDERKSIKNPDEPKEPGKRELKEKECEKLIADIISKSQESEFEMTYEYITTYIANSTISEHSFLRYIRKKYDKGVKEYFESIGVLQSLRSEFDTLIATLKQRYENKAKKTDVTSLIADNTDLDLAIVSNNVKRFTGLSTRDYLLQEGILINEVPKSIEAITAGVLYKPGEEPERIKKRLDTLFAKFDVEFPDKVVSGLNTNHKKWGETVTDLYRQLGYASNTDFLIAYGYKPSDIKGGRPKADHSKTIEELKRRYPNGTTFKTAGELVADNPDIAKQLNTLKKDAPQILGMPFGKWLKQEGLLG